MNFKTTLHAVLFLSTLTFLIQAQLPQSCPQVRVRKEWRTLSATEKRTYTAAVVKIQNLEGHFTGEEGVGFYAKIHQQVGRAGIHNTPHFLPWHRYFTYHYEEELRKYYPSVVQHYWDASLDYTDYWSAPLFGSSDIHFGGNGVGPGDCVQDGPFKDFQPYNWTCLERDPVGSKPNIDPPALINEVIAKNDRFWDFARRFEMGFHAQVHVGAGGIMAKGFLSPNEPLFFMHHSNVDRIWTVWQSKKPSRLQEINGPQGFGDLATTNAELIFFSDIVVADVMDIAKLCYTYDNLIGAGRFVQKLSGKPNSNPLLKTNSSKFTNINSQGNPLGKVRKFWRRGESYFEGVYDLGEIVNIQYPTPLPKEWILLHNADFAFIRKIEAEKRVTIDRLNALKGYVSPACLVNKRQSLLKKLIQNPGAKAIKCTVKGQKLLIRANGGADNTLKELLQREERLISKRKPSVEELAAVIGKPCFSPNALYNPFNACKKN